MFVYVDIDDHAPTRLIIERLVLIMKAYVTSNYGEH